MPNDRLEDYPLLKQWLFEHPHSPPNPADQVVVLVWSTCKALSFANELMVQKWSAAIEEFFEHSTSPLRDFIAVENTLAKGGMDFMNVATEVAELAIRMNRGDEHYELLATIADKCDTPVFRFLAAWTALNCGRLEDCINQCEAVDDPYGCIYTVLGQAQLESGCAHDAIETLLVASELTPDEVLGLFQLAKAYHVTDQFDNAWKTLERIQLLAPNNTEVAAFFAMIALNKGSNVDYLDRAWGYLTGCFDPKDVTPLQIGLLLDIAFVSRQDQRLNYILANAPWAKLRADKEFMANVPWILKKLETCGWNKFAQPFLDEVVA